MSARTYWNQYVQKNGGAVGVAAKLGIPYADSSLDKSILIWVTPMESKTPFFNQDSHNAALAANEEPPAFPFIPCHDSQAEVEG